MPYPPTLTKGLKAHTKGHVKRHSLPGSFKPGMFTSLASIALSDSSSEDTFSNASYTDSDHIVDQDALVIISADGEHIEAPYTQVCAARYVYHPLFAS